MKAFFSSSKLQATILHSLAFTAVIPFVRRQRHRLLDWQAVHGNLPRTIRSKDMGPGHLHDQTIFLASGVPANNGSIANSILLRPRSQRAAAQCKCLRCHYSTIAGTNGSHGWPENRACRHEQLLLRSCSAASTRFCWEKQNYQSDRSESPSSSAASTRFCWEKQNYQSDRSESPSSVWVNETFVQVAA
jgi:hypothetical protein